MLVGAGSTKLKNTRSNKITDQSPGVPSSNKPNHQKGQIVSAFLLMISPEDLPHPPPIPPKKTATVCKRNNNVIRLDDCTKAQHQQQTQRKQQKQNCKRHDSTLRMASEFHPPTPRSYRRRIRGETRTFLPPPPTRPSYY